MASLDPPLPLALPLPRGPRPPADLAPGMPHLLWWGPWVGLLGQAVLTILLSTVLLALTPRPQARPVWLLLWYGAGGTPLWSLQQ